MLQELNKYYYPLQVMLDLISIIICFAACAPLSLWIGASSAPAPETPLPFMVSIPAPWGICFNLAPFLLLLPLLFLHISHRDEHADFQKLWPVLQTTSFAVLMTAGFLLSISFITPLVRHAYLFLTLFLSGLWICLILNRLGISVLIRRARRNTNLTKHLLIIGTNAIARQMAHLVAANPEWGIVVAGYLSTGPGEAIPEIEGASVIGTLQDFPEILSHHVVDSIFMAGGTHDLGKILEIAARCELEGIDFGFSTSAFGDRFKRISVSLFNGFSMVFLEPYAYSAPMLFIKRVFDIVVSVAAIVLLLPFWIIVPIWIMLDSPGPAIYRHDRVGKHGRRFTMYKFRSMVAGADKMLEQFKHLNEMDGPVFKIRKDPRFTGIGKMLRRTSIDELPQLFNVLKGDMSLVGPRPPLSKEVVQYLPWQKKRLSVIPGITCLWQVTGRNEIKFNEWIQLDLQYIENWSLTLDLKILVKTMFAVLSRRGAE